MKNLIIIGARGFGREVHDLALDCIEAGEDMRIKGFLDDKTDALDGYVGYADIISSVEDYNIQANDVFTCALGSPENKKKYIDKIVAKGGRFINLISPHAIIRRNALLGTGCIITAGSNISVDTVIGDYVSILSSAIGHDAKVGDYSVLSGACRVNGFVEIEQLSYLGCNSMIYPHKKVGEGAFVGMGSVVVSNIKPGRRVFGNPAKRMEF